MKDQKLIPILVLATLLAVSVVPLCQAGDLIYFDPANGDDLTGTRNDINQPYQHLYAFQDSVRAGDTLYLRGGTYSGDYFHPKRNGTPQEPIQILAYPGEIPTLTGEGRYNVIFLLPGRSYYIIDGIHFENTQYNCILLRDSATRNVIRNCSFRNHTQGNMIALDLSYYNIIEDNYFDAAGSPAGYGTAEHIFLRGARNNLIQNNHFLRAGHYVISMEHYLSSERPSKFNIFRNNRIDQHWGGGIGIGLHSEHNLVEGNTINFIGEELNYPKAAVQLRADNNILRNNIIARTSTNPYIQFGIAMEAYIFQGNVQNCRNNRIYNNVIYKCGDAAFFITQRHSSWNTRNKVLNNIVYHNQVGGPDPYFGMASLVFDTYHAYPGYKWQNFPNDNYFYNNLMLHADDNGDLPGFSPYVYYDGAETFKREIAYAQTTYPLHFYNNIELNPMFRDEVNDDFHLTAASPAIDSGAYLTQTTAPASATTTVPVEDALFFTDGFEMLSGDEIQIGGNLPVVITKVDYTTHVLTVNLPVTFEQGDPVSLSYTGSAPDMGAFEYYPPGTPPILYPIGDKGSLPTVPIHFRVTAKAVAGGQLVFSIENSPSGATFSETSAEFNWIPGTGDIGEYQVTFTVNENGLTDSETITITVADLVITNIQAVDPTRDHTTIEWDTNLNSDSEVEFGFNTGYGYKTPLNTSLEKLHAMGLDLRVLNFSGMTDMATIHYRVQSKAPGGSRLSSPDYTFDVSLEDLEPAVLSDLSVTQITRTRATISWRTNENTDGYVVCDPLQSNLTADTAEVVEYSVNEYSLSHVAALTNLTPGTTYYYRVFATDLGNNVTQSSGNTPFTTEPEPPTPQITNLQATNVTETGATITWDTDVPSTSQVQFGQTPAYGFGTPVKPLLVTSHSVDIDLTAPSTGILEVDLGDSKDFHVTSENKDQHLQWSESFLLNGLDIYANYAYRGFIKFNLDSIPLNAKMISATMNVIQHHDSFANSGTISVHRMTIDADYAKANYRYYDGEHPWTGGENAGGEIYESDNDFLDAADDTWPVGGPNARYLFDVTKSVQYFIDHPEERFGWLVRSVGNGVQIYISSMRYDDHQAEWPVLTVRYQLEYAPFSGIVHFRALSRSDADRLGVSDNQSYQYGSGEPDTAPPVISDPTVDDLQAREVQFGWSTDEYVSTYLLCDRQETQLSEGAAEFQVYSTRMTHHSARITGLEPLTTYYYRVVATDAWGNVAQTGLGLSLQTPEPPPDTDPPQITAIRVSNIQNTQAVVSWNTDENATTFVLCDTQQANLSVDVAAFRVDSQGTTSHTATLTGLAPGTRYYYRIVATDSLGNTGETAAGPSLRTSDAPKGDTTPPVISNIGLGNLQPTQIRYTWSTNEASTSYVLCDRDASKLSDGPAEFRANSSDKTNHLATLTGLVPSTLYYYRVVAIDSAGNRTETTGSPSFTTLAPDAPITLTFQQGVSGYDGFRDFEMRADEPDTHLEPGTHLIANSDNIYGEYARRPYLRFDVNGLLPAGATVHSATVELYHNYIYNDPDISLHRVTLDVDYTAATRNTRDGLNPWSAGASGGGIISDSNNDFIDTAEATTSVPSIGWYSYNVSGSVAGWIEGTYPNYGWAMLLPRYLSQTRYYCYKNSEVQMRPKLHVTFVLDLEPPEVPVIHPTKSLTNQNPIRINGTMSSDTEKILVNGFDSSVTLTSATTWQAEVTLTEGENTITVTAADEFGNESAGTSIVVVLDQIAGTWMLNYFPNSTSTP